MKKIMFGILLLAVVMVSGCELMQEDPDFAPRFEDSFSMQLPIDTYIDSEDTRCSMADGMAFFWNEGPSDPMQFYARRDLNDDGVVTGREHCEYDFGHRAYCVLSMVDFSIVNETMDSQMIMDCGDDFDYENIFYNYEGPAFNTIAFDTICCI
ncbi:hypothetical protein HN865_01470 [Candidatus Woesearchaeota archaeon]|jgi:hypothetical protein|nr:hypothetical protein [Candidatus Woesearchaeota archaeon]MBT7237507.1 hypothetical protein [Candidatus Woesearchaeota archaeon]